LKSKHCGAQSDLGTTRAKVVEALTEVRRAKIDGPALIFDDQLCELYSEHRRQHISVEPVNAKCPRKGQ
jgi:hypothetical protein